MTFIQDLQLVELILSDVEAFAAGQPVTTSASVAGKEYTATVVVLKSGVVAPYQDLGTGSVMTILFAVLADVAAFQSGSPIAVAIKVGSTWYGLQIALKV